MEKTHEDGFGTERLSLEEIKILKRVEEPYKAGEFDGLVEDIASLMKVNVEFLDEEAPGKNYAESVLPWLRMISFKEGVENLRPKVVYKNGKSVDLDFRDGPLPQDLNSPMTEKQALSVLAITEAKLMVVKELMTDVFPTLAEEADGFLEMLKSNKINMLGEHGYRSVNDFAEKLATETEKRRTSKGGKLLYVATAAVIATLILSACSTVNAATIEGSTPTSNIPTVTEVVQATPMTPPTETPVVAPTLAPVEIPTEIPTEIVVPTEAPRKFLIGEELPRTAEECRLNNYIKWENLDEEMERLLEQEKKISLWGYDEMNYGGTGFVVQDFDISESLATLEIHLPLTTKADGRPWVLSCAYTEREIDGVNHELYIFTRDLKLRNNPGVVIKGHFGYEPLASKYSLSLSRVSEEKFEQFAGLDKMFSLFFAGNGAYLKPTIYGGEIRDKYWDPNNSEYNPKIASTLSGMKQIKDMADKQGYQALWEKIFISNEPLTEEEIYIAEHIIFPTRSFFMTEK